MSEKSSTEFLLDLIGLYSLDLLPGLEITFQYFSDLGISNEERRQGEF